MEDAMMRVGSISFLLISLLATAPIAKAEGIAAAPAKLGTVAFANSCAPAAQDSLHRGVALLHSFWFAEGDKAFREALDRDPGCAIATWGIATILIGNTFPVGPSPAEAQRALEAIDRGRAIAAKTQRERDYIEALPLTTTALRSGLMAPGCDLFRKRSKPWLRDTRTTTRLRSLTRFISRPANHWSTSLTREL
jgi:hypothetical protein